MFSLVEWAEILFGGLLLAVLELGDLDVSAALGGAHRGGDRFDGKPDQPTARFGRDKTDFDRIAKCFPCWSRCRYSPLNREPPSRRLDFGQAGGPEIRVSPRLERPSPGEFTSKFRASPSTFGDGPSIPLEPNSLYSCVKVDGMPGSVEIKPRDVLSTTKQVRALVAYAPVSMPILSFLTSGLWEIECPWTMTLPQV